MEWHFYYEVRGDGRWEEGNGLVRGPSLQNAKKRARQATKEGYPPNWRLVELSLKPTEGDSFYDEVKEELLPEDKRKYEETGVIVYDSGT